MCAQHDMESCLGSSDSSLLACFSIYQAASFFGAMPSSSSTDPVLGREDDDDDDDEEQDEAVEEVVHVIFDCDILHRDLLLGGEQDEAGEEVVRWRRNASAAARTNHMLGFLPVSVLRVWFVHWVCIFDCGLLHRDDW